MLPASVERTIRRIGRNIRPWPKFLSGIVVTKGIKTDGGYDVTVDNARDYPARAY